MNNDVHTTHDDLLVMAGRVEALAAALAIAASNFPSYPNNDIDRVDQLKQLASRVRQDIIKIGT